MFLSCVCNIWGVRISKGKSEINVAMPTIVMTGFEDLNKKIPLTGYFDI